MLEILRVASFMLAMVLAREGGELWLTERRKNRTPTCTP